ncbi:hypothetical protein JCGZ_00480 [Jatropha curcas]|uniref:Uncharacterized protein n=1 Tax=Jatropha curcas TaxID=180498 RepID=A0A067L2V3_JATCU|nr:hypothetical protein JCGZ_00480 [Jatropha curcas]
MIAQVHRHLQSKSSQPPESSDHSNLNPNAPTSSSRVDPMTDEDENDVQGLDG